MYSRCCFCWYSSKVNPFPNLIYGIPQVYLQVSAMLFSVVLFWGIVILQGCFYFPCGFFYTRQEDVSVGFLSLSCCDLCVQPDVLLWCNYACIWAFKCSIYYWWLRASFTYEKKFPTMLTHGKRNALLKAASVGRRVYLSFQAAPDLHQITRGEQCCLANEGSWLRWCWFPRLMHTSHILPPVVVL